MAIVDASRLAPPSALSEREGKKQSVNYRIACRVAHGLGIFEPKTMRVLLDID